jgi:NAD(P)-dependent dehydrogenase (short-subunit alcohol dehydrogenase family)
MMTGKVVVITGATRGLGRVMTAGLIAAGHTVVGCGRSEAGIAELARSHPAPHRFSVVNVADEGEVVRWAEATLAAVGPPDLLLNNAAVMNRPAPLWKISAQEFDALVDVNIKGVAHVLRQFLPAIVRRKAGVVVNFSSGWGRSTSPEVAPYCATKWAIEGLSQSVAQEVPQGVAVIALNPGIINTDMLRECFAEGAAGYPSPEVWARTAVPWLLKLSARDNGRSATVGDA